MSTQYTTRNIINTQYQGRKNLFEVFLDYLNGYNNGLYLDVEDENGDKIIIFADSGFQKIISNTKYTTRPLI